MTKQEVLEKLAAKLDANHAEVRRQLEFLANLPEHQVHHFDQVNGQNVDLLAQLSTTWKEGRAMAEIANELVVLVYPDPAPPVPPEARPS